MFRDGPTLKLRHYAKQAFKHTVHVKLGKTDSPPIPRKRAKGKDLMQQL